MHDKARRSSEVSEASQQALAAQSSISQQMITRGPSSTNNKLVQQQSPRDPQKHNVDLRT